jgi:hypothetical protein
MAAHTRRGVVVGRRRPPSWLLSAVAVTAEGAGERERERVSESCARFKGKCSAAGSKRCGIVGFVSMLRLRVRVAFLTLCVVVVATCADTIGPLKQPTIQVSSRTNNRQILLGRARQGAKSSRNRLHHSGCNQWRSWEAPLVDESRARTGQPSALRLLRVGFKQILRVGQVKAQVVKALDTSYWRKSIAELGGSARDKVGLEDRDSLRRITFDAWLSDIS